MAQRIPNNRMRQWVSGREGRRADPEGAVNVSLYNKYVYMSCEGDYRATSLHGRGSRVRGGGGGGRESIGSGPLIVITSRGGGGEGGREGVIGGAGEGVGRG